MEEFRKRLLTTTIVCVMIMSGLMALPTSVDAKKGQPDLAVKNMSWIYPVIEGEDVPFVVYVYNQGNAPVETGFWLKVNYAELPGFWQEPTVTHQIWVEPPIKAGTKKAVEITLTALTTHQMNIEAILDTTNIIAETNEENNEGHVCLVSVGAERGSPVSVPIFLRNENLFGGETFTVEADPSKIPDGWSFSGGVPPTTVTAAPGGNVALSEGTIVPGDTHLNPVFRINATRQSDRDTRIMYIKVLSSPEIGFSFSPFLNEFCTMGIDQIESDETLTKTILEEKGYMTIEEHTVTNIYGQYVKATLEMHSNNHMNMYKILEINYNGETTIIPENNMFLTTFGLDDDGNLKHYYQYMKCDSENYQHTYYDAKENQTTMKGKLDGKDFVITFDGFDAVGVRILNDQIATARLDTRDLSIPLCMNDCQKADCYMLTH